MKTKIIAFLLMAALVLCALPTVALAQYTGDVDKKLADGFEKILSFEGAASGYGYTNNTALESDLRAQFSPYGNSSVKNADFNAEDGRNYAVKVGRKLGDYYLNVNFINGYINASTATSQSSYAKAYKGYQQYAGKSFVVAIDLKVDTFVTDESDACYGKVYQIFNLLSAWTVPNASNPSSSTAFFTKFCGANSTTGEILYYPVGSVESQTVGTGVFLSKDHYTSLAAVVDPTLNKYTLYADGVEIATGKILGDSAIAGIACDSQGDITKRGATDVTGLTAEEAKAKRLANFTPTTFRFFQSDGMTYYADNIRIYSYTKSTVKGYDLTINDGTLGLNYYLDLNADVLADQNAKVVFTTPRGEVQETLVKDVTKGTDGTYKFTATVSSVEMAGDVTMQIVSGEKVYSVYTDGKAKAEHKYSVKAYAEKLLTDATYGAVAKAMLNYGAAAQTYFEFDTENLANANCAYTTELDAVGADISAVTIAGNTGAGTKAALVLDSNTSIVIYDKDGNKIGEKTGINSLNLDASYVIECEGDKTVTVSVLAIGEKVLASSTASAEYKALVKALKLFSDKSLALS